MGIYDSYLQHMKPPVGKFAHDEVQEAEQAEADPTQQILHALGVMLMALAGSQQSKFRLRRQWSNESERPAAKNYSL